VFEYTIYGTFLINLYLNPPLNPIHTLYNFNNDNDNDNNNNDNNNNDDDDDNNNNNSAHIKNHVILF
jgi:hypothetical protein